MSESRKAAPDGFSARERALLARYVTDTEGSVFALTNLPEVVKGALFSRYSRSELGLRELLLTEFIQAPESEFAAIGGLSGKGAETGEASAREAQLAVKRAQDFYGRILDGYGDDSIGELGGAHLALENVSMIATKVLEDARIGGSPLEKSTRYVYFADQVNGEFRFYREPALLDSRHGDLYLATNRALFETYRDLIAPLTAHVEAASPRVKGVSEAAWRRSVRARVFDGLRGLLPAGALTNMGIYGNGRFFETLLIRLQTSPLAELRGLGGDMFREMAKVIPAFIRRADPGHRHFAGFADYGAALEAFVVRSPLDEGAAPDSALLNNGAGGDEEVRLVDFDSGAPAKVLGALYFSGAESAGEPLRRWAAALEPTERARRLEALGALRGNRRHKPPRALELAFYTFELVGDFGMYRDLHRHRMLTQQRQPLTTRHGFDLPGEVVAAGLEGPFAERMEQAAGAWETIAADFPAEAQYLVPMAYRIRWQMHINLRALIWLVELRSSPQGHPAYRRMAQQMFRRVSEVHPEFAPLFRFVDLEDYPLGRIAAEQRTENKRNR